MTAPDNAALDRRKTRRDAVAVACLLLCSALWGLNQVATRVALIEIAPLTQAAARSLGCIHAGEPVLNNLMHRKDKA